MTTRELAAELVRLEGVDHTFEILVTQIVAAQREASVKHIMEASGAGLSGASEQLAALDRALEKVEHNLRCQYDEFLAAHIDFRAEKLTPDELALFVEALADEKVQAYLSKARSLQQDASAMLGRLAERMFHSATAPPAGLDEGHTGGVRL